MGEELDRDDTNKNLRCLNEVYTLSPEEVELTDEQLENAEEFIISMKARIAEIQTVRAAEKKKLEEKEEQKENARDAQEMARWRSVRPILKDQNTASSTSLLDDSLLDDNSEFGSEIDIDENVEELMPTINSPRVDFLSFIASEGAYLSLKKQPFPLDEEVKNEGLGFPLGVAYDEKSKNWIICDSRLNKIMIMNPESQSIRIFLKIQSPSAVVVYTEGDSVAVLSQSSENKNQHNIHIYNYTSKEDLPESFALHTERIYDMRSQLRGLAKSVAGNIISLESGSTKRLRVFKRGVGGKGFEIKGASRPSFLATYRSTVAVSDLGVNKVFIINLDDTKWDEVAFSLQRVLYSTPEPDLRMDVLVDQTGFKFVAGMQFDINGHLLIGDAKGHTIKLYDTDYEFLHRISSDFPLPYMSSFHINSKGECVILDVHGEKKLHWVKMESLGKMLPWLPGPNPLPRGGLIRRTHLPQGPRRGGFQNKHF